MSEAIEKHGGSQVDQAMTIEGVMAQINMIQGLMSQAMKPGEHYGIIPGTSRKDKDTGKELAKPSLLKPGAEKISLMFRLAPSYYGQDTPILYPNGHMEYRITCTLTHITRGEVWGQGLGSCSTLETKYRYRKANQVCPECGKETIIKGKKEFGGGWLCYAKKGGCGAKFEDNDTRIENQNMGRVEYENPADYYNTVLKIAKKRAYVDAILSATAASDFFTQDLEDMAENGLIKEGAPSPKADAKPAPVKDKPADNPATTQQPAAPVDKGKLQFDGGPEGLDVFATLEKELAEFCNGDDAAMQEKLQALTSFPQTDKETKKPTGKMVAGKRFVSELRMKGKNAWAGSALKKLRDEVAGER